MITSLTLITNNKQKALLEAKSRTNVKDFLTIKSLILAKVNCVFAVDHLESAVRVAEAIIDADVQRAEALLHILRNIELTEDQLREVNNIINRAIIQQDPNNQYAVNQLNLHNAGVPQEETWNIRQTLTALGIAVGCTITMYFISRYWNDIRDALWSMRSIGAPVARAVLLTNIQLVSHNPQLLTALETYFASIFDNVDAA